MFEKSDYPNIEADREDKDTVTFKKIHFQFLLLADKIPLSYLHFEYKAGLA